MTMPIAVAATQIAWGLSLAPKGFNANASTLVADTLQWAGNYLTLCVEGENYAVQVSSKEQPYPLRFALCISCLQLCCRQITPASAEQSRRGALAA